MESIHNSQRSSIDFEAQSDHSGTLELVNEKDTTAAAGLPEALLPSNWSNLRKWRSTIALCVATLSVTYASSSYVPPILYIMEKYDASRVVAILGVSLFVLGFGFGPIIWGSLSDQIGRRRVYIFTFIGYVGFSWGVAWAPNLAALLLFRFFAGVFGSSAMNNAPASIMDYTTIAERGFHSSLYALSAFGGPGLGPCLGTLITIYAGPHWVLRVNAIFTAVAFLWLLFDSPESHVPTLTRQYEMKMHPEKGEKLQPASNTTTKDTINRYKKAIGRPFYLLFTEPVLLLVSLYLAFLYALIYGLFGVFPIVYRQIRHFSEEDFAYSYFALILGFVLGAVLLLFPFGFQYAKASRKAAPKRLTPDRRFASLYWTSWTVPMSFILIAATSKANLHWIGDAIAQVLFAVGVMSAFTSFIPFLIDYYQADAGAALAAATLVRCVLGCAFPLFTTQMYEDLGVPAASSIFLAISLLLVPTPWILRHLGYRLWPQYL